MKDLPKFVQQYQANMAAIFVTAALDVLKKDFNFTAKQLNDFNDQLQKRAIKLQQKKG